jgi:hypothetical protein
VDGGAGGEERQVERPTVPRHDDAGVELGQQPVEGGEQPGFVAGEHDVARLHRGHADGHHAGDPGIQAVVGRVRLDVETVEGTAARGAHAAEHTEGV